MFETNNEDIFSIIISLRNTKCNSVIKVPVEVLKSIVSVVTLSISIIINHCISRDSCIVALHIKKSVVVPTYKYFLILIKNTKPTRGSSRCC